jgi:ABC-type phosphate transport system substrate-binding protein
MQKIEVGFEGIAFMTNSQGAAADCINRIGGLTKDQIRWMFSNYNRDQLVEEDWDPSSVHAIEDVPHLHLWSDLHPECERTKILISGVKNDEAGADKFFKDSIFVGDDENFDFYRELSFWSPKISELAYFLANNDAAITYVGLSHIISPDVKTDIAVLKPVPVRSRLGTYLKPGDAAFGSLVYPLARRLYMNLLNNEESLKMTRPFVEFGLSEEGIAILKKTGFWTLNDSKSVVMKTRVQTETGIPKDNIMNYCSSQTGRISFAGSSTVFPVAQLWTEVYSTHCNSTSFSVVGGGSSEGAKGVCASGDSVDVGDMSRQWKDSEARQKANNYTYECLIGDPSRSVIQIDVAIDGLTVATKRGGVAARCIELLGGLSINQLRWMYSSYSDSDLELAGWNPDSLRNNDGNPETHLWSELHPSCEKVEIRISGPDVLSGTRSFFDETVLVDYKNGEAVNSNGPFGFFESSLDEDLVAYLNKYEEAISYFGHSYYAEYSEYLFEVPIENGDGAMVLPSKKNLETGAYSPLGRRIYMNIWDEDAVLTQVTPLVEFGLSQGRLVEIAGYTSLNPEDTQEMIERLKNAASGYENENVGRGAIIGVSVGVIVAGLLLVFLACKYKRRNKNCNLTKDS